MFIVFQVLACSKIVSTLKHFSEIHVLIVTVTIFLKVSNSDCITILPKCQYVRSSSLNILRASGNYTYRLL